MSSPYDEIADWYDSVVRGGTIVQDAAISALRELAGDVRGLGICDLACGQGIVARALSDEGATVVGIDTSVRLLEIARAEESAHPRGIEYAEINAETLVGLSSLGFDGVVCNLALMDIEDLSATSASIYRVLRHGGWFAFTIMHPCFQTSDSYWSTSVAKTGRMVRAYFEEGRWQSTSGTGMRARTGSIHRTLSSYFNNLSAAGLVLKTISEPQLARESGKSEPAYDVVPAVLAARFVKP